MLVGHQKHALLLDVGTGAASISAMEPAPDVIEKLLNQAVVVHERWPQSYDLPALPAFDANGAAEAGNVIRRRLGSLRVLARLRGCPILGVCGGLDAGKSSVTALFLSPEGRQRVPRGMADAQGTHRFVLWLPESWLHDAELRSAWDELLEQVFGPQRDLLSKDAAAAHHQYNDASLLEVPLLAGDPQLETLRMGVLDCPDIMTDPPDKRLNMLRKASALCAALVVVQAESQVRSVEFSNVLEAVRRGAPRVRRYILVNQTDPERNYADLLQDVRRYSSGDSGCYVALHFKIFGWREHVPTELLMKFNEADPVPLPWLILENDEANAPAAVTPERFFEKLPSQLDAGELFQTKTIEHYEIIREHVQRGFQQVEEKLRQDGSQVREAHEGLRKLCETQMTDALGNPKQIFAVPYVLPLLKSMERTAPGWLRWVIWLKKPFKPVEDLAEEMANIAGEGYEKLEKKAPEIVKWLMLMLKKPWGVLMRLLGRSDADEAECKIDPAALAKVMHCQRWCPLRLSESDLCAAWVQVLRNTVVAKVDIPSAERFDAITHEIWNVLPWHKQAVFAFKLTVELASLVAVVVCLALLPFDGSSTFIAAATLHQVIIGTLIGGMAGGAIAVLLNPFFRDTNTLPYLSAMLSYACDVFGLPRQVDPSSPVCMRWGDVDYKLPKFGGPVIAVQCAVVEGGNLAEVDQSAKQRLIDDVVVATNSVNQVV